MIRIKGAILAALLVPLAVKAQDGVALSKWSEAYKRSIDGRGSNDDVVPASLFMGYVLGSADSLRSSSIICVPPNASPKQIAAVVSNYIDSHPEKWSGPAPAIVGASLVSAFPCK